MNYSQPCGMILPSTAARQKEPQKVCKGVEVHLTLWEILFLVTWEFLNIHNEFKKLKIKTSLLNCFTRKKLFQTEEKQNLKDKGCAWASYLIKLVSSSGKIRTIICPLPHHKALKIFLQALKLKLNENYYQMCIPNI